VAHYVLERPIGEGGMAEVFRARAEGAGGFARACAVKRVLPHLAGDEGLRRRFVDEARISGSLRHPCIVAVLDAYEEGGRQHLVMELVEGASLEHLCLRGRGGRFVRPELAVRIVREVARALDHAHGEGVLHRDVSCCNVLVSRHGEVKLGDFGLADARGRVSSTEPGSILGKTAYLSPERLRDLPATASDDLFSLGVVLDQLLLAADPRARASPAGQQLSALARQLRRPRASRLPSAAAALAELAPLPCATEGELAEHVRSNPQPRPASAPPAPRRLLPEELDDTTVSEASAGEGAPEATVPGRYR